MESVLEIISVNSESHGCETTVLFQAKSHPFCICDIQLPDCNTEFVYMLISCRNQNYSCIGETKSI